MTRMKHYIMNYKDLDEAAYSGNIGFEEMVKFYQEADKTEIAKLEKLIKNDDWDGYKKLIQDVLNIRLK
jgi:enolase